LPLLSASRGRDRFLSILEQTRQRYRFVVAGYVVMPEHIHLLITEPEVGTPATVMQVLKQRTARALLPKKKRADARQRCLFKQGGWPSFAWHHTSWGKLFRAVWAKTSVQPLHEYSFISTR
jgi:REP element-mobilizing transposase RayT